jgi:hypothetical protein
MGTLKIATSASTVGELPAVSAQPAAGEAGPEVTAEALAEALDPQLVARLAAQARAQGCRCWAGTGCCSS